MKIQILRIVGFTIINLFLTLNLTGQREGKISKKEGFKAEKTIRGQIIDEVSGEGLEFATVSLFSKKDSALITGALSETSGMFELKAKPGQYYAQVEFISYTSKIINDIVFEKGQAVSNLGPIAIKASATVLENIEITAEKSETTFALDKKVFTVGKDLANRGGTAEDVLDNVPSVTVDIDGVVSLRGSEGIRILVNGRPSGLAGVENTNGLRNIPSNMIEKVEVITNPSARYEAEGMAGIINIVLKKNDSGGFNGSFDLTGGYPYTLGTSANLNYRNGPLNWFVNLGFKDSENPGGGDRIQDQVRVDEFNNVGRQLSLQDRNQNRTGLSKSIRLGADYFFSDKEQITGAFMYRTSDEDNLSTILYEDFLDDQLSGLTPLWEMSIDSIQEINFNDFRSNFSMDPLISSLRTDDEKEDEKNLEYSLNYRKQFSSRKHFINGSIQYRDEEETESSLFLQKFEDFENTEDLNQRSQNAEGEKTWLVQIDYVHPLGKDQKWEAGFRSSLRDIKNDFIVEEQLSNSNTWTVISSLSNNFIYNEDIHAAYGIYGNKYKKISYQVGLRSEHSIISTQLLQSEANDANERTYTNLFPSGHLNYSFNEKSALQLSYSSRVRRPRFWDLNPFFTFADNRNFFSGNPNINPEFTDSYELGQIQYWDNLSLNSSLFYRQTESSINRILSLNKQDGTTLRTPVNVGTVDDYGLDLSVNYTGIKWLRVDANFNIFRNQLSLNQDEVQNSVFDYYKNARNYKGSISDFQDEYLINLTEVDNITWNGKLTTRFTFWGSDLQLRANYRGPRASAQGQRNAVGTLDIGWSKDFLSKKMTVTLSIRDLFNSRKRQGITYFDDFVDKSEFMWRSRSSTITLSYRINQKKKRGGRGSGSGNYEGGQDF